MSSTRVIGLISGTSVDAIDVAVADLWLDRDTVHLVPLGHTEVAYPTDVRQEVLAALPPRPATAEQMCKLDTWIGQAFATAAGTALTEIAPDADLVASLGQTVYHWVDGTTCLGTLQLGQPAWIAERTGLPVVSDLRARDVAAGGHGAPLAGLFDQLWLGDGIALNIGGIANITSVVDSQAYDTGPGNALLDLAADMVTGKPYDEDGALAKAGTVRQDLLDVLLADPYYAQLPPKSTGKEHFNAEYLGEALGRVPPVDGPDLLATLVELTACTIANACVRHDAARVVASGGGVRNPALMAALATRLDVDLVTSDSLGIPSDAKEAYLTALLGFLTWHGIPADPPTGARGPRLLGSITPGHGPLRLPEPATTNVTKMEVATGGARADT
ncbi:anhydro-N-acetylmuramic acid kinase [Actinocrispum wychmicini]|uniref:Anhydro-N-acetylmuramic acid kinase n=1 Tax=Actinocrispum wychmicini TaxID=1213861 RepID=A0A4R2JS38_9PSEU|nr:anhydro-N-acetylmuramic acid kinase [Actinocrispum wychmicini]TCO56985.1 anhydro-N-acetylmuramic acid kinase [Actinocrispum wychmicini]